MAQTNPNTDGSQEDGNLDQLGISAADLNLPENKGNQSQQNDTDDEAKKAEAKKKADEEAEAAKKAGKGKQTPTQGSTENNDGVDPDEAEAVLIDDKEYKLDKDGNAVGEDGKVFKTKDELEALANEEEADDEDPIESYIKEIGIRPLDEKGKPKKYEDTTEGLKEYNKDVLKIQLEQQWQERTANPEVKALLTFIERGGNVKDYVQRASESWKRIQFDPKNTKLAEDAIIAKLKKAGIPEEQARFTVKAYADTGKLEEYGKQAYDGLVAEEDARETREAQESEARFKQEEENTIKHWKNVESIINKGKLHNIVVPEAKRKEFFSYLAIPIDEERNSKASKTVLTDQQWLELEYLKFSGFNYDDLVKSKAETKRIKSLRSKFAKSKGGLGNGEGVNKDNLTKSTNLDHINIDKLV